MRALIILVGFLFVVSGCARYQDCGSDINCFKDYAKTCTKSKLLLDNEKGNVLVTLRGIKDGTCGISFKIAEVKENVRNSYPDASELKGKTLNCFIPMKYENKEAVIADAQKFEEYCTGQIKEIVQGPLKDTLRKELIKI